MSFPEAPVYFFGGTSMSGLAHALIGRFAGSSDEEMVAVAEAVMYGSLLAAFCFYVIYIAAHSYVGDLKHHD
jgi:hypothetical protein